MGTIDSKKLESGPGTIYAGFPSSQAFEVGAQSYSSLLASAVHDLTQKVYMGFLCRLSKLQDPCELSRRVSGRSSPVKHMAVVQDRCLQALRQHAGEPKLGLEHSAGSMFDGQHVPMLHELPSLAAKGRQVYRDIRKV